MSTQSIYLLFLEPQVSRLLESAILGPAGYHVTIVNDLKVVEDLIRLSPPSAVIIGENASGMSSLAAAESLLSKYPILALILLPRQHHVELEVEALRTGFADYLAPPVRSNEVLTSLDRVLKRKDQLDNWMRLERKRNTKSLQRLVDGMEALHHIGQKVTSLLNPDSVLKAVVDAVVELTGAEEGSLLLLDEVTGDLYMQAARNFQEDFVRTFRLPIQDTLPGQVIQSGKPLIFDAQTPHKIKTSYLVHTLIYVPLRVQERIIGVLGVDNRQGGKPFKQEHVPLISALADYAAIAIENARLYTRTEVERKKLETILTHIEDGVIVIDQDLRLVLVNQAAREALSLNQAELVGLSAVEVLQHTELLEMLSENGEIKPCNREIILEDGRVYTVQLTPIPEVGLAITMQDITHHKELDRVKSDFVSTVSHDLRSPLTAILGYVELIARVGPVNDQQREFIRRVQFSVNNITTLINDLLDLGRIEAGFDIQKEIVPLKSVITYSVEGLRSRIEEKKQELTLDCQSQAANILGNPVRLKQMISNLLGNAVKYTQEGGQIRLYCRIQGDQVIVQLIDNGPGIPPSDHPYLFDKFFRASNIPSDTPGTGLGLAIVKSIVENHQGRIWVESSLGQGTTFTVVLPSAQENQ
jgi:two-component system, OmpR family, phosphate regulon sensor histidine kinase PhoR